MIPIEKQVSALGMKHDGMFKTFWQLTEKHFQLYLFSLTPQPPCFDHVIWVLYIQLQMLCFFESPYIKLDSSRPDVCLTRADPYREVQKYLSLPTFCGSQKRLAVESGKTSGAP